MEEAESLKYISSTRKGCGSALAAKVLRRKDVVLAKDVKELAPFITKLSVSEELTGILRAGGLVIGESAQGFGLSLNHGFYPYVTSRDITPAAFLSNIGIPTRYLGHVIGTLRTFPIRVGNQFDDGKMVGTSGPHYDDQIELSWEEMQEKTGNAIVPETTTVTGKIRRIFTFSKKQLAAFERVCDPTLLAVTFVDYVDSTIAKHHGVVGFSHLNNKYNYLAQWLNTHFTKTQIEKIVMLSTGSFNDETIELVPNA
jgi:adenylosuccinate synthase